MNFIWHEIKFIHMNLYVVRMKFIWTSYRIANEVNMLYICNTNEVGMRLINSSHEIHEFRMIWTSCELHKNHMTRAQEVPMYYTWILYLAFLLCNPYKWASRSIVNVCYKMVHCGRIVICANVYYGIGRNASPNPHIAISLGRKFRYAWQNNG